MSALLWAGTVVGAACGLGHGVYVYNRVSRDAPMTAPGGPDRPKAISYAIWTLALWMLFGVYVGTHGICHTPVDVMNRMYGIFPDATEITVRNEDTPASVQLLNRVPPSTAYIADKVMVWVSPTFPQAPIALFLRGCLGMGLALPISDLRSLLRTIKTFKGPTI